MHEFIWGLNVLDHPHPPVSEQTQIEVINVHASHCIVCGDGRNHPL